MNGSSPSRRVRRHNPDRIAFIYLGFNLVLAIIAQVVLKTVSVQLESVEVGFSLIFTLLASIAHSPQLLLGLLLYGGGEFLWLLVLSRADLAAVYPYTAINFVLILVGSAYWLHEAIHPIRVSGVLFVTAGVVVFALDERRAAARERARLAAQRRFEEIA